MGLGRLGLDHDEGAQKVWGLHNGAEGGVGLPEHDRHDVDVVVDVSLPLELLEVCLGEGEECGHVVHDLLVAVLRVRVHAMLPLVRGQAHPVHDHVQEPVQSQGDTLVPKQRLLANLACASR